MQGGLTGGKIVSWRITSFLRVEDGPTATEYAIILSLVCVLTAMASIIALGSQVNWMVSALQGALPTSG